MRYVEAGSPIGLVHRGGGALAPENTLAAFAYSASLGYRYLESDIRATADGRLVLFHDATLDRVTDGTGPVAAYTLRELRRLQVRGPDGWESDGDETAICSLRDALDAFPDACFSIDLKEPEAVGPLIRLLRRPGVARRVCVAGAWDGWLDQVRAEVPQVATTVGWRALVGLITCARLRVRPPRQLAKGDFVHVPVRLGSVDVYGDTIVSMAHDLGLRVVTWTVDDPDTMNRLYDAGVDAVITDRPDLLREVLLGRDAWVPMRGPARTRHVGRRARAGRGS